MKTEKSFDKCIYSIPDWTNVCNSDHYCSNKQSEEYGYNAEYLNGCDEWKSIENLGNNGSICTKTGVNDEDRTMGDTISRHAAIDALTRKSTQLHALHWGDHPEAPHIESGVLSSIEIIRELPPAQPERQVELDGTESNIEILSELRAQFNCFDEAEEPCYRALSDAICALSAQTQHKTARWEILYPNHTYKYHCSECGANHKYMFDFCPSCGARMED